MEETSNSTSPKAPPLGGRIFLGPDGLLRPIWRVVLFVFVLSITIPAVSMGWKAMLPYLSAFGLATTRFGFIVQNLPLYSVLLAATAIFIRVIDRRRVRTLGLWFYEGWLREVAMGICCGGALIAATVGGMVVSGGAHYTGFAEGAPYWILGGMGTAIFVLLAAAGEEIAFRGYAFQRLVDSVGKLGAVVLLSALFGLAHLKNPGHPTAISTANTALAGVLLAVAYLKTRGLWLPIGLHWAWNFFLGPVFGLPVSGFTQPFQPYLLKAEVTGPEWLTGSTYGPEGSILLTVACIAAIVWLARTRRISASPAMQEVLK